MTKTTNPKTQSPGCLGCLGIILMLSAPHFISNFSIAHTGPMSPEESSKFQQEAEQVRIHLQAGECNHLYQDFFQSLHADLSSEDFAEVCTETSAEYQAVESAALASTQCETIRYPFKDEEYGSCTITYDVSLSDDTTFQETHEWYLENGDHHLVGFYADITLDP